MPPTTDWRLPLRCPRCATEAGHPFSVHSKCATEVIVNLRCRSCAHEWVLERETPALTPKAHSPSTGDEHTPD